MIYKPFYSTYRKNIHLTDTSYIYDLRYADHGQRYIDSFKAIQKDLLNLFEYVHPCDSNKSTYSLRIQDIYVRACIEVEANFTAIMSENGYFRTNFNMNDFCKVNKTHFLSDFMVTIPQWEGMLKTINPFSDFKSGSYLQWYRSYNKLKHERYKHFENANLINAITAVCANLVLLSSQFYIFELGNRWQMWVDGDETLLGIGGYFHVKFPVIENDLLYDYDWNELKNKENPFCKLDFDKEY